MAPQIKQLLASRNETKSPLSTHSSSSSASSKSPNLLSLIYTKKWDLAQSTIQADPTCTQTLLSRYKDTPLHEACQSGAPFHLIQLIHKSNPTAISQPGFCGRLPIHYASYCKPSLHTMKYLIQQNPQSVTKLDDDGRLPLHFAIIRNAPKDVIQTLIASYPKSMNIVNAFGNTPEMLARNDIIYALLMEEKKKPRDVEKGLDLRKKLMKGFLMEDLKLQRNSPVNDEAKNKSSSSGVVSPVSITSTSSSSIKQDKHNTTSTNSTSKSISNKSPKRNNPMTPTISNKNTISGDSSAHSPTKRIGTSSTQTTVTTTSRSRSPSDRSHRTIQATDDDMVHLERSTKSKEYKASRLYSPKSLMDINGPLGRMNMMSRGRRPTSTVAKREIMSSINRRKVLPSPTRMRMVVHPIWK